jgi:hypothetical protein
MVTTLQIEYSFCGKILLEISKIQTNRVQKEEMFIGMNESRSHSESATCQRESQQCKCKRPFRFFESVSKMWAFLEISDLGSNIEDVMPTRLPCSIAISIKCSIYIQKHTQSKLLSIQAPLNLLNKIVKSSLSGSLSLVIL